jgi:hypothetical protein
MLVLVSAEVKENPWTCLAKQKVFTGQWLGQRQPHHLAAVWIAASVLLPEFHRHAEVPLGALWP